MIAVSRYALLFQFTFDYNTQVNAVLNGEFEKVQLKLVAWDNQGTRSALLVWKELMTWNNDFETKVLLLSPKAHWSHCFRHLCYTFYNTMPPATGNMLFKQYKESIYPDFWKLHSFFWVGMYLLATIFGPWQLNLHHVNLEWLCIQNINPLTLRYKRIQQYT